MHSPHLLPDRARAQLAPWVAAMAVFFGIAAALLAGGAHGPLASAEANGDRGSAAGVPALEPEPVLGSEDLPPAGEPGTEEPPIEEPPVEEPPVGVDPDPAEPPVEQPNEPPVVEPDPGEIPAEPPSEVPPEE